MRSASKTEWFHTWFDSPYYHMLYKHRDGKEAAAFLTELLAYLKPSPKYSLLDLACGKGRHSLFLSSQGYHVTGVDLSECNIRYAKQFENDRLRFFVQDMRQLQLESQFDCIFNLFTSFGYFSSHDENIQVLSGVKSHLREGGTFVLDYFNAESVVRNIGCSTSFTIDGVKFGVQKHLEGNCIRKEIVITDQGKKFHFEERVQLLNATMLHALLNESGLKPVQLFGDYRLAPFDAARSERLIIIARNV